nr:hypothetical protein [Lachnospiraceae bacterium]
SGNKTKIAGLSTVTGIGGIVSLTVPVVGTVAGIPLMVAGFAGSFLGTKSVTTLREQMIDSYFRVDDFVAAATAQMEKEGRRIYDKDEFRVRIRRRLLAEAGFSGLIGASTHIAKKYAVYISEILFSENANRDKEEKKAYIQLVKSLGLKYSESKRKPEAYMIARKLSGR